MPSMRETKLNRPAPVEFLCISDPDGDQAGERVSEVNLMLSEFVSCVSKSVPSKGREEIEYEPASTACIGPISKLFFLKVIALYLNLSAPPLCV